MSRAVRVSRECAWCGRPAEDPGRRTAGWARSGVCDACHARVAAGTRVPLAELVGSRPSAAFLLDADHTIGMVNRRGLALLGKPANAVLGERTGSALECENAHLPGGCGQTMRCSGCGLRQSIAHTHLTGEPRYSIRTTLTLLRGSALEDVRMSVSTTRIRDRILLEIRDFQA